MAENSALAAPQFNQGSKHEIPMRNLMLLDLTRSRMAIDRLERLHNSIEQEIRSISENIDSILDDGEFYALIQDECEQIEELLGIAFVIAQGYLTSVRTALAQASVFLQKRMGTPLTFVDNEWPL
jgi:hypothetical protein